MIDKSWKLQRYDRKDYTELVEFPVEIVGRDGVIRRYSFEDAIRLYQRRISFASVRYRDPDLAVVPGTAKRLYRSRLLGRSRRSGSRTETVTLRNPARRARSVYVAAYVHAGGRSLDAAYDLVIRRGR